MTVSTNTKAALLGAWILALGLLAADSGSQHVDTTPDFYPYGSAAFHRFVADSYQANGAGDPKSFHQWMDRVAPSRGKPVHATHSRAWTDDLDARRNHRSHLPSAIARADAERREIAELHRWEKRAIPRFSLDRGFEFTSVVNLGERQCLLQSVLLASLFQKSGVDAGAVMVFRNGEGEESNLGHVVTLVKLSVGHDVLTDASHKEPFVRQNGLFVWVQGAGYRFVEPVFVAGSPEIESYRFVATGKVLAVKRVRALNTAFLRSQFAYYRGERTPGGTLADHPTRAGLIMEAKRLEESVAKCPQNPLSTYMLGRVCLAEGRTAEGLRLADRACTLYRAAGWVPPGAIEALQQARAACSPGLARADATAARQPRSASRRAVGHPPEPFTPRDTLCDSTSGPRFARPLSSSRASAACRQGVPVSRVAVSLATVNQGGQYGPLRLR